MRQRRRYWIVILTTFLAPIAVFFATAKYGDDHAGIHYISRSPVASISWGPKHRYIVQDGVNIVFDRAQAQSGNFIEFPVSPSERVSLRLFSFHWLREDVAAWKSKHGLTKCSQT